LLHNQESTANRVYDKRRASSSESLKALTTVTLLVVYDVESRGG
jgi:hypothetical protein